MDLSIKTSLGQMVDVIQMEAFQNLSLWDLNQEGVAQGVMTSGGHSLRWWLEECLVITAAYIPGQL